MNPLAFLYSQWLGQRDSNPQGLILAKRVSVFAQHESQGRRSRPQRETCPKRGQSGVSHPRPQRGQSVPYDPRPQWGH